MQHLDDGFLHALADGEVPSGELGPVREHLEACDSCRARLDEARMEAEAARELVEMVEVPALAADRRTDGPTDQPTDRRAGGRWTRGLALAASLVLAAGIGYYGRGEAPFATAVQPVSVARIDTVFLEMPPAVDQPRESDANRFAGRDRASRPAELAATPPAQAALPAREDARSEVAGDRRDDETLSKRRVGQDSAIRLDQVVVTGAAAPSKATGKEEARASKDALQLAAPAAPSAEARLMARSAADAAAPVIVTFPRAAELLGGRIRLIEGMVPARLEAVGRMVRVVYVIDEGELVLSQVAATDSLSWSLAGPLTADSLARLRSRVK